MTDFFRPHQLSDALEIARTGGVTITAGCTDLFPATQAQALRGPVLDVTGIAGMRGITQSATGWRIGAATTWTDILRADLPGAFDGLRAAAREVGSVQIQNAGTIGGNLCNASPAADGVPALLTLDAEVELCSTAGTRRMALDTFLTGPRQTLLAPGELLTAVLLPPVAGTGGFLKLGARRYLVISIAMVAARLEIEAGHIRHAALAVGACSAVARRLPAQEAALTGAPVARAASRIDASVLQPDLSPITDIRADATYRAHSATVLMRRLVVGICQEAEA
ncbi:FAD binding domain-containing protein [Thalassovita taeanensis]|uniref:CO or xanthine dehydrogenase, FAD-binding subunit n=1 Tax=Thalassovita taeanensis TaxID=657014 RepID=A0A1H9AJ33_9RHOB|nr:FAD binding domain-containing protein [Thalassovita taeanensis]SEP76754.1 CO or xanthine dehydrogenase, FAD-binding subunit [Thalassovita taeanensis]